MLVCAECGAANEKGEDFCGDCGAYLEWETTPTATETRAEPPPVEKEQTVAPVQDTAADDPASALVVRVPPPRAVPDDGPPTAPASSGPAPAKPATESPAAVRPGAATPKPRRRQPAPREPLDHGDLVCGACGAGNKPTRRFCRRCGRELVDAELARLPWWRRLFRRRRPPTHDAGDRPARSGGRRRPTRYVVLLLVLAVVAAAAWSARGSVRAGYQAVADRVLGSEQFHPATMRASSSARGAPASRAHDGFDNRFWAAAQPGNAREEYLVATFDQQFRLMYLIVHGGVSGKQPEFLRQGRPRVLRLAVVNGDGERSVQRLTLKDEAGPQEFHVPHDDVARVRLTIVSSRPGTATGSRVAIAEVEFRGRG